MRGAGIPVAVASAWLLLAGGAWAAPGDLDPRFGESGRTAVDLGRDEIATRVEPDAAGRLIVRLDSGLTNCQRVFCNYSYSPSLLRFGSEGRRDRGFGPGGLIQFPETDFPLPGLGLQPDGTIVLGSGDSEISAVRPDGSAPWPSRKLCCPRVFTIEDRGAIVIGGAISLGSLRWAARIERRTPLGQLDPGFGDGGIVTIEIGDYAQVEEVIVDQLGRITAMATQSDSAESETFRPAVIRLLPDGSLDESFDGDGIGLYPFRSEQRVAAAGLQSDGALIVRSFRYGGPQLLRRILPDGSLDQGFGEGGLATVPVPPGFDLEVLSDDRILVPGGDELALFDADGSIDRSFGDQGTTLVPNLGAEDAFQQADGAVVLAGSGPSRGDSDDDLKLARITFEAGPADADADGLLDGEDRCRFVHGPRPSGCPKIALDVTLKYKRRARRLVGQVRTEEPDRRCGEAPVLIRRRIGGRGKIVRRGTARQSGRLLKFDFRFPRRKGRYRAVIPRQTIETLGRCERARSERIRIKPPKRR